MTQNNLGNALCTLGEREDGTERLEQAALAHHAALEVFPRPGPAVTSPALGPSGRFRSRSLRHIRLWPIRGFGKSCWAAEPSGAVSTCCGSSMARVTWTRSISIFDDDVALELERKP
jgi:hypothetical protein